MAGSLNQVSIIGNCGKDPEARTLNNGGRVVNLSVATSESWRDKQTGEKKEVTEWHRVVIFNEGIGKVVEQYVRKGSKVFVQGKLQTRKWTDQAGVERYSTEIVLGPFNAQLALLSPAGNGGEERGAANTGEPAKAGNQRKGTLAEELDDEIPFGTNRGMW